MPPQGLGAPGPGGVGGVPHGYAPGPVAGPDGSPVHRLNTAAQGPDGYGQMPVGGAGSFFKLP